MPKTIAFATNQHQCDRLIRAAYQIACKTGSQLLIVGVSDSEYALDPQAADYLFTEAKKYKSTMRMLFTEDKTKSMREIISQPDSLNIVTGMPGCHNSVLYDLWRDFPDKDFYTVDSSGEVIEVATKESVQSHTA